MMKDVAFGQYYPTKSFVHNLDPRLKIVFLIAYIVACCLVVLMLAIGFSRIPVLRVFKAIKGILFLIIFTTVLNLLFYNGETVYAEWWIFTITKEGIIFSIFLVIRLVLLITCSSLLTYTTTPVALTDGIESLLFPLTLIRFPVRELAQIMSIALRYIPILIDETERIMNAQKARGANFETGGLASRVRAVIPVLIPLLLSSFRRAEELGDAMEARCYTGGRKRTKYKKLRFTWRDLIAFLLGAALITGVVLLKVYLGATI